MTPAGGCVLLLALERSSSRRSLNLRSLNVACVHGAVARAPGRKSQAGRARLLLLRACGLGTRLGARLRSLRLRARAIRGRRLWGRLGARARLLLRTRGLGLGAIVLARLRPARARARLRGRCGRGAVLGRLARVGDFWALEALAPAALARLLHRSGPSELDHVKTRPALLALLGPTSVALAASRQAQFREGRLRGRARRRCSVGRVTFLRAARHAAEAHELLRSPSAFALLDRCNLFFGIAHARCARAIEGKGWPAFHAREGSEIRERVAHMDESDRSTGSSR